MKPVENERKQRCADWYNRMHLYSIEILLYYVLYLLAKPQISTSATNFVRSYAYLASWRLFERTHIDNEWA